MTFGFGVALNGICFGFRVNLKATVKKTVCSEATKQLLLYRV